MTKEINFILMRHGYDDHSYIDGLNDTSLTEKGIAETRHMAGTLALQVYGLEREIIIRSSSKKRSVETSEIIVEQFERDKIPYSYLVDQNLRELYQGNMKLYGLSHEEKVGLLQSAWEVFDAERVTGNDNYRFGQPHVHLRQVFVRPPFGESQNQFTLRIAKSFMEAIDESIMTDNLPLFITHRGGIREIQNMTYAFNNQLPVSQSQVYEMTGLVYNGIIENRLDDARLCMHMLRSYIAEINSRVIQ
jgi:broad specificity phosphatase PhoE